MEGTRNLGNPGGRRLSPIAPTQLDRVPREQDLPGNLVAELLNIVIALTPECQIGIADPTLSDPDVSKLVGKRKTLRGIAVSIVDEDHRSHWVSNRKASELVGVKRAVRSLMHDPTPHDKHPETFYLAYEHAKELSRLAFGPDCFLEPHAFSDVAGDGPNLGLLAEAPDEWKRRFLTIKPEVAVPIFLAKHIRNHIAEVYGWDTRHTSTWTAEIQERHVVRRRSGEKQIAERDTEALR